MSEFASLLLEKKQEGLEIFSMKIIFSFIGTDELKNLVLLYCTLKNEIIILKGEDLWVIF